MISYFDAGFLFLVRDERSNQKGMLLLFTMFTIVAIGHGLLKKFWPMVIGYVLRTAGNRTVEYALQAFIVSADITDVYCFS